MPQHKCGGQRTLLGVRSLLPPCVPRLELRLLGLAASTFTIHLCIDLYLLSKLRPLLSMVLSPCCQRTTACTDKCTGVCGYIHYNPGIKQQPVNCSVRMTPVTFHFIVYSFLYVCSISLYVCRPSNKFVLLKEWLFSCEHKIAVNTPGGLSLLSLWKERADLRKLLSVFQTHAIVCVSTLSHRSPVHNDNKNGFYFNCILNFCSSAA